MQWVVVYPETVLQYNTEGDMFVGPGNFGFEFGIEIAKKYRLTLDGVKYELNVVDNTTISGLADGATYSGNLGLIFSDLQNTGEPFFIWSTPSQNGSVMHYIGDGDTKPLTCTIKIESYTYTSEQYKYKLMKLLQRNFRMKYESDRYYTRAFFAKLFEDIIVTEETYKKFVVQLEDEMIYCAEHNIYACENLDSATINERGLLLKESFAALGIDLVINTGSWEGTATFTKPDGTVMTYTTTSGKNYFYINAKDGRRIDYAVDSHWYWSLDNMEVAYLDECNYKECGPNCWWEYDADTQTMTITGPGTCVAIPTDTQIGAGAYSTVIFSSSVGKVNLSAVDNSTCTNLVFLHSADAPLEFYPDGYSGTTCTKTIYADNETVKSYAYPTNWTVTHYGLDEWEG